jgi:hypothetical protein
MSGVAKKATKREIFLQGHILNTSGDALRVA